MVTQNDALQDNDDAEGVDNYLQNEEDGNTEDVKEEEDATTELKNEDDHSEEYGAGGTVENILFGENEEFYEEEYLDEQLLEYDDQ